MASFYPRSVYDGLDFEVKKSDEPMFQMFRNETFRNTVGGAIAISELNEGGVTLFVQCKFYNNYGEQGGAIDADRGGALIAIGNTFSNDARLLKQTDGMKEVIEGRQRIEANLDKMSDDGKARRLLSSQQAGDN